MSVEPIKRQLCEDDSDVAECEEPIKKILKPTNGEIVFRFDTPDCTTNQENQDNQDANCSIQDSPTSPTPDTILEEPLNQDANDATANLATNQDANLSTNQDANLSTTQSLNKITNDDDTESTTSLGSNLDLSDVEESEDSNDSSASSDSTEETDSGEE